MISPLVSAILLLCSNGNPEVAQWVEREAIRQDIDPAWALAVGVLESGLKPGNTMGVRGCYGKQASKKGTRACIRIGVTSLHNRLWDAKTRTGTVRQVRECFRTVDPVGCRALIAYNNSTKKYEYARRGSSLVRKLKKMLILSKPET